MALSRLESVAFRKVFNINCAVKRASCVNSVRTVVYSESGAILKRPERVQFGLIKVLTVVGVSVTIGGFISKHMAQLLEENEWFVPDEDDD